ncbi:MAG TPA: YidC/Oxa1 family membrane protein insertase [Solirubrobacteraceae bacterium]|jgi:YidC/Oxa1 family membrane protein insertase|nr:YidC/Oxa1 family membrane protein insertase [Solirubrobacteraceae bacterium]
MPIAANVIQEAFSPLIAVFEAILVFIHNDLVGGSWGLAIVGLTVVIRAVLLPLTLKQFRSMQELQRLAPELKALQEKYKDDKQRQQQEIMNFYREHKVNPFASCLPLLLQLPVFISLFYMLRTDLKKHICGEALVAHYNAAYHTTVSGVAGLPTKYIEKTSCQQVAPGSGKFLFIPDITNKATGAVLIVLLVLYVGSQLASTMMMSASADPSQRRLMMIFPLFFVIILYRYPAGLLLYWITTNLWTIGQSYFVRRTIGAPPPPVATAKGGGGSSGKPTPNGKPGGSAPSGAPALAGAGGGASPPPPPRKKKKRSGRRR